MSRINHRFVQNLSYALRQLRRAPGFTLTAVLTLSLTVGLAATVFSVFDALLVRPLPYGDQGRIVNNGTLASNDWHQPASLPELKFWREHNSTYAAMAGSTVSELNLLGPQGASVVHGVNATEDFFAALGVTPLLGRAFGPEDKAAGREDVTVLTYALWKKRFNGKKEVLGSKIDLDGRPTTVIGVMPAGFRWPLTQSETAYTPLTQEELKQNGPGFHWLPTFGRLKPGVSLGQAEADMNRVMAAYARVEPNGKGRHIHVTHLADALLGQTGSFVRVLALSVVAVLALGCVNIAGLMLVRGLRRERELALQVALGASRRQLAARLFAEIAVLALAGTVGGALAASGLLSAIRSLLIVSLARGAEVTLNVPILLASLAAALLTLGIAGMLPLRQLLAVAPAHALRAGGAGSGVNRGNRRLGSIFVASQMALAMVLLATGGLLLRTLGQLRNADFGFPTDHLLMEDVRPSPAAAAGRDMVASYYMPLLERVRQIPGVKSAALFNSLPPTSMGSNGDVEIAGKPPRSNGNQLVEMRFGSADYYRTMGSRLLRGRLMDDKLDTAASRPVIVVNETFAKKLFSPGEDPIGKHITRDAKPEIIGVVSDQRQSIFEKPAAEMDYPAAQIPPDWRDFVQQFSLVLHTDVPPLTLAEPLRKVMQAFDPTLPFRPAQTMDDVIGEALVFQRMEGWLFGTFAALAVLLAVIGLYGLIAQQVEWGRRDIGIRMALGARRWGVVAMVLRGVARVSLAGLAAGLLLSFLLRRVIGSVLPVQASHGLVFVALLSAGMELVALLACAAPARRAASVDPIEVLRAE